MNGEESFREMRKIREDLRVILSSGYSESEATRRFTAKGLAGFLQKPYTADELGEKLRAVLAAH
jgi:DNA-binding NtrC family response regulator